MKNRIVNFLSILFVSTTFLISCSDDDNENQIPTSEVTTSKEYTDVEAANNEINAVVEDVFSTESGINPGPALGSKVPDCATVTSETLEETRTVVIDFGDGCEINGEMISGSIRMSFSVQLDAENKVEITYSLENFKYKDVTVSGNATTTFTFRSEGTNTTFTTNSNFSFAWAEGLTATSETNFVNETFLETNPDTPGDFDFYTLNSGSSSTTFSNGDKYSVEITTPLRNESGCQYIVSGIIVTNQNSETTTLDYGNGECDNTATQTDSDGNETIIDL